MGGPLEQIDVKVIEPLPGAARPANAPFERSHRIYAEEFYRLLDGVIIDDTKIFNNKLQEWEDYYNYHRPRRRPRRPNPLRTTQTEDPTTDPGVATVRQSHTETEPAPGLEPRNRPITSRIRMVYSRPRHSVLRTSTQVNVYPRPPTSTRVHAACDICVTSLLSCT